MRSSLALAAIVMLVLAPIAWAEDAPGLALAKSIVEGLRGDAHREKMRIVWPEGVEATPPEGAEVTLITGYIDCEMTRFVWHEGKVEARSVFTARSWFYNLDGESFAGSQFDVDPAKFAIAWSAARFVAGARDEPIEPEPFDPERDAGGFGAASHESHRWVRLRLADSATPLHVSDQRGMSWHGDHVYDWDDIRDGAVFRAFEPQLAKWAARRPLDEVACAALVSDEITRAAPRLDLRYFGEHRLLLEVCLRVAGEMGDAATRVAVGRLDEALRADTREDERATSGRENVAAEVETAATKLRLRLAWDSVDAKSLLTAERSKTNRESDLEVWIRHRYRDADPVGYLAVLESERDRGRAPKGGDLARTLDRIRVTHALGSTDSIRGVLTDDEPAARVAAARAILSIVPGDRAATDLIDAAIRDARIQPDLTERAIRWARVDALEDAVQRRAIAPEALRILLAADESQHGLFVQALINALAGSSAPLTEPEVLMAWRRSLERTPASGMECAVDRLIDLKDSASRAKIASGIETLRKQAARTYRPSGYRPDVGRLLKRLAAEMPEPAAPK